MKETIQQELKRRLDLSESPNLPDDIVTGRDKLLDSELRHLFTRMAWELLDQSTKPPQNWA